MATKRKTTTGIIAGVTAAALLLGGTFAWTSISQQAKNETAGVVNVGGRLHDDFNGTNKDVYVENFTDPLNGGQPIYARIKLTEYMEVGSEAGEADNANRKATPVVAGTDINDVNTWTTHIPSDSCMVCATSETCAIHDHWVWTMGNQDPKVFMPTFNKDKDSLAADINGTYAGTNANDKIYYDDYVTYVTENGLAVDMNDATFEKPEGAEKANPLTEAQGDVTTVTGTAYYDDDADAKENDHATQEGVRVETETHTAKETGTAKVITMAEWLADPVPGNYWVYDEDGWAYWANPIMPGEATGLLLDGIEMTKNPGEKCYYAINVVGQFATVNDWEYFYNENNEFDGTKNALTLLETASKNVTVVTVTNNGPTTLSTVADEEAGTTNTTTFTATAVKVGDSTATVDDAEFTWAVYDADLNPVETSTITVENGIATLTIDANEKNANLIIAATHTESGAVGLASVAIDSPVVIYRLAVSSNDTGNTEDEYYTPYEDLGGLSLGSSYTVTLTANDKALKIAEVGEVTVVASKDDDEVLTKFGGTATLQEDGTVSLTVGDQDTELGSGQYDSDNWKVIKLTVKDSEGVEYSRNLLINSGGVTFNDIMFRDLDGALVTVIGDFANGYYTNTHNLTVNTTYTFEPGLYSQSNGIWNAWLDSIWFDDSYTVTAYEFNSVNYEAGAVATSVTIKDNTIIFAEAGSYKVEAVTNVNGYEERVYATVTVTDPAAAGEGN